MRASIFTLFVVAAQVGTPAFVRPVAGQRVENPRDRAGVAVKALWSDSEEERQAAKLKIIQTGEEAAPPLLALLQDLARNPSPRFPTGKEQEGALAVERATRQLDGRGVTDPASQKQLHKIVINGRLRRDVIELLGSIRSKEAIPALIEEMETQDTAGGLTLSKRPEMTALLMIGTEAVAPLINEIEDLSKHPRLCRPAGDPFVAPDADPDQKGGEWPLAQLTERLATLGATLGTTPEQIESQSLAIQIRAAIVLGEIGDPRALAALEQLRARTTKDWATDYLDEALYNIREKMRRRT